MKQINENTLCYKCLGCNRLELEEFQGTNICENHILVDREPLTRMSSKTQEAIIQAKVKLGIIEISEGEQMEL